MISRGVRKFRQKLDCGKFMKQGALPWFRANSFFTIALFIGLTFSLHGFFAGQGLLFQRSLKEPLPLYLHFLTSFPPCLLTFSFSTIPP